MRFDKQFLVNALPDAVLKYENFPRYLQVVTDSRLLEKADFFVALKGRFVDGHDFILEALNKGAIGLMIESRSSAILDQISVDLLKDKLVVIVPDALKALMRLAMFWREQFNCTVIGVTGSVGKSSTKEIIRNILDEHKLSSLVSYGNQNSLIGVAINLLKMREQHQVAVFELGISTRGEMSELVEMVRPTIAVITGIGHSHMAGLGALSDIAEEKRTVFKFFKADNVGIINGDHVLLSHVGYIHPVLKFGLKTTNQIQARKMRFDGLKTNFTLKIYQHKFANVQIYGTNEGAVYNALAAAAVACLLNIPAQTIVRGIEKKIDLPGRFEFKSISVGKGGQLIDDCYNASPESMKTALASFDRISGDYEKIIVLSDMNELGVDAPFWHRQVGRLLCKVSSLGAVLLIGNHIKQIEKILPVGFKVVTLDHWQEGLLYLEAKLKTEKLLVLVKGSTFGHTQGLAQLVASLAGPVKNLKPAISLTHESKQKNIIL
jgi:UDP-N-acetylmuramoyl-tripeptide--D-alanyl-D-alanine ligase